MFYHVIIYHSKKWYAILTHQRCVIFDFNTLSVSKQHIMSKIVCYISVL